MQKWDAFVEHLTRVLSPNAARAWLKDLTIVKFDALNLHLLLRDRFQYNWFCEHVLPLAPSHFANDQRPIRIHLHLPDHPSEKSLHEAGKAAPLQLADLLPIKGQRLAQSLLDEISATGKGDSGIDLNTFNPIFFYGPTGCGKTHLLHSCATRLVNSGERVISLDGDAFTQDVVGAIRRGEMESFRQKYRSADVLLIDGVDRLANKSATQEEFFHTFNSLHMGGKQIVASAPHHPQNLKGMEQRLVSRFEWGIAVEIGEIDAAEMLMICQSRQKKLGLDLTESSILELIAQLDGDLKKLSKALETLAYKLDLTAIYPARPQDQKAMIHHHLRDLIQQHQSDRATPQAIIDEVAAHFGIRSGDILGRSQNREFTRPRRLAMYLCRSQLQLPFVKIGEIFQRDHSTVMSNCKHIEKTLSCQQAVPDLLEVSRRLDTLRA